jgi:hypothetical protein
MKTALQISNSLARPKYMKTSRSVRASINSPNEDLFNVEEMMTNNKIKKFREIGSDKENNTSVASQGHSK